MTFYITEPYMVVVTGYPRNHDTKLVNMDVSTSKCSLLGSYPYPMWYASGGLINNQLTICGGYDGNTQVRECHKYDTSNHEWTLFANMQIARSHQASTTLHDGSLWITGKSYF